MGRSVVRPADRMNAASARFHDLRHTAATLLLAAGVPLKTVSDILGHSSIQITVDTYGYTFDEDK
jgi:integrase